MQPRAWKTIPNQRRVLVPPVTRKAPRAIRVMGNSSRPSQKSRSSTSAVLLSGLGRLGSGMACVRLSHPGADTSLPEIPVRPIRDGSIIDKPSSQPPRLRRLAGFFRQASLVRRSEDGLPRPSSFSGRPGKAVLPWSGGLLLIGKSVLHFPRATSSSCLVKIRVADFAMWEEWKRQTMIASSAQEIADQVTRRAQRQGFILPREIREEVSQAGLDEERWKDVLKLARPSLRYHRGRYYYQAPVSDRVRQEQSQQRDIHRAVRQLIKQYRMNSNKVERREQDRVDFVQTIKVRTEDDRQFTLLSRDLSPTGIRLISTRRFLGQKLLVQIPGGNPAEPWTFLVRVLWTCAVGDDLYENGGTFLEVTGTSVSVPV